MKTTGNTILITGGGSGIGLALAEEFTKRDNQVIVAGRSAKKLETAAKKGLHTLTVDMMDAKSIEALAQTAIAKFPALNMVIHNAGIMKNENLQKTRTDTIVFETIATNLTGPLLLTEALLPHFLKLEHATIMTVTSGLAYMPLAMTPTYSATKAAIHSYTQSLRYQLKGTQVEVLELAPPYVATELMGTRQASDPMAMPLGEFVAEVMQILDTNPTPKEILVKRVHPLRFSASQGQEKYEAFYREYNDRVSAARAAEF